MRISCDESDAGYAAWAAIADRSGLKIFVDDTEQRFCTVADDVLGFVERLKVDSDGNFCVSGDEVVTEQIRGVVRIELPASA